jgi:hypothetical protein
MSVKKFGCFVYISLIFCIIFLPLFFSIDLFYSLYQYSIIDLLQLILYDLEHVFFPLICKK